jgi:hypothetical protein
VRRRPYVSHSRATFPRADQEYPAAGVGIQYQAVFGVDLASFSKCVMGWAGIRLVWWWKTERRRIMEHYLGTLRGKMIRETEQFLEWHLNQDLRALAAESLSPPSDEPREPRMGAGNRLSGIAHRHSHFSVKPAMTPFALELTPN